MVSKCANPQCSASFRYFHQGKLFRFETEIAIERGNALNENGAKKSMRKLEFYWLCDGCAETMTMVFKKGSGVSMLPLIARANAA